MPKSDHLLRGPDRDNASGPGRHRQEFQKRVTCATYPGRDGEDRSQDRSGSELEGCPRREGEEHAQEPGGKGSRREADREAQEHARRRGVLNVNRVMLAEARFGRRQEQSHGVGGRMKSARVLEGERTGGNQTRRVRAAISYGDL